MRASTKPRGRRGDKRQKRTPDLATAEVTVKPALTEVLRRSLTHDEDGVMRVITEKGKEYEMSEFIIGSSYGNPGSPDDSLPPCPCRGEHKADWYATQVSVVGEDVDGLPLYARNVQLPMLICHHEIPDDTA